MANIVLLEGLDYFSSPIQVDLLSQTQSEAVETFL